MAEIATSPFLGQHAGPKGHLVYQAEADAFESGPPGTVRGLAHGRLLWADVVHYAGMINESRWYRDRPGAPIRPVRAKGSQAWGLVDGTVALPPFARKPTVILHEVAHVMVDPGIYGAHGAEFLGTYLALVTRYIGRRAATVLQCELERRGAKICDVLVRRRVG